MCHARAAFYVAFYRFDVTTVGEGSGSTPCLNVGSVVNGYNSPTTHLCQPRGKEQECANVLSGADGNVYTDQCPERVLYGTGCCSDDDMTEAEMGTDDSLHNRYILKCVQYDIADVLV